MPDETTRYVVEIQADTSQAQQSLDEASSKLDGVEGKARKVGATLSAAFSRIGDIGRDVGNFFQTWYKYSTEAPQQAAQAAKTMSDAARDAASTARQQADAARSVAEDMNNAAQAARTVSSADFSRWQRFTLPSGAFSKEADKIRAKIADIEQAMETMRNTRIPTDDYRWLQSEIAKAEAELQRYSEQEEKMRAFGEDHGKRWERLQYEINLAHDKLADYNAELQYAQDSGTGFKSGADTAAYSKMEAEKAKLEADLAQISAQGESQAGAALRSIASAAASAMKTVAKTAFQSVWNTLKKIAGVIPTIVGGLRRWHSEHNKIGSSAKKIYATFTNLLRMLQTRLKRKFISAVFEDMQATMQQLAQISPRFNAGLSALISSLKALGTQIIAAFEPLISIVTPILSRIVDIVTDAAGRMAELISAATGDSTWLRAVKGQYDYASSVNATTKSTKAATKATKEYQASVLGFDQLNKLSGNDSDAGLMDNATLDTVQNNIDRTTGLMSELYDAFTKHDWKRVGGLLGQGLSGAFSWISGRVGWLSNGAKITAWLHGMTDAFNGFIEGLDGDAVGSSIGDVLNTLVNSFEILTERINWSGLGSNIARSFGRMLSTINWSQFGKGLINGVQGIIKALNGFLSQRFDGRSIFGVIGKSIADGLRSIIDGFDPDEWSDALAGIIDGFFEFMEELFSDQQEWERMASKIADTLNQTLKKIDPQRIGAGISALARTFTTVITTLISEIDWGQVLSTIIDVLGSLDWGSVGSAVGIIAIPTLLKAGVGALASKGAGWLTSLLGGGAAAAGSGAAGAGAGAAGAAGAGGAVATGGISAGLFTAGGVVASALTYYLLNREDINHIVGELKKYNENPYEYASGVVSGTYKDAYQYHGLQHWFDANILGVDMNNRPQYVIGGTGTTALTADGATPTGWNFGGTANTAVWTDGAGSNYSGLEGIIRNAINSANTDSDTSDTGDIVFMVDGEELARVIGKAQSRINRRNNPFVAMVSGG